MADDLKDCGVYPASWDEIYKAIASQLLRGNPMPPELHETVYTLVRVGFFLGAQNLISAQDHFENDHGRPVTREEWTRKVQVETEIFESFIKRNGLRAAYDDSLFAAAAEMGRKFQAGIEGLVTVDPNRPEGQRYAFREMTPDELQRAKEGEVDFLVPTAPTDPVPAADRPVVVKDGDFDLANWKPGISGGRA